MDESRCIDVSRQSRGRKRSRSLENNSGERRESRASSIASVSSDAKYNREHTGASQGIISPAAHTKYSGKNPVASYKIIPSEPSELDPTYFEELAAYSSEAASIATRKHQCQICGQRYRKLSSLEIHISGHEGQKRFQCDYEGCGKRFIRLSKWCRHRKLHESEAVSVHDAASLTTNSNDHGQHGIELNQVCRNIAKDSVYPLSLADDCSHQHKLEVDWGSFREGSSSPNQLEIELDEVCSNIAKDSINPQSPADDCSQRSSSTVDHYPPAATMRPHWEPPILDYRKFEEGGSMYDSLVRHPETKPERWYHYTDAEINVHLLGDYHDWIRPNHQQAVETQNAEREKFYVGLQQELNIDRFEAEAEFEDIKEKMYVEKKEKFTARPAPTAAGTSGRRVQKQFDNVRKAWRLLDSEHSDWDEGEWSMFNIASEKTTNHKGHDTAVPQARTASLTEANLHRLANCFKARTPPKTRDGSNSRLSIPGHPPPGDGTSATSSNGYHTAEEEVVGPARAIGETERHRAKTV